MQRLRSRLPGGAISLAGRAVRRLPGATTPLVLLYHSVAAVDVDPWGLAVTPGHFADQMRWLKHNARVVPASEMDVGDPGQVVITFDDGYANNLHAARVLEGLGLPATFFIASGWIGTPNEFWWDILERLVFSSRQTICDVVLNGDPVTIDLSTPGARMETYVRLHRLLRPLPPSRCTRELGVLADRLEGNPAHVRDSHRVLTQEELVELAMIPGMEIGGHTVTHPCLADHDEVVQAQEVRDAKAHLEHMVRTTIDSFSYPYGIKGTFSTATEKLVASAGYRRAFVVGRGPTMRANPFRIPRRSVLDWNERDFAEWIVERRNYSAVSLNPT
jgi:peptidoglycan/xylan/chitin deacetylase (PgdA/CDA1 family)